MANIVVDLTPLLPGGENGGSKSMVLELVRQLGKVNPADKFLLLIAECMEKELQCIETHNIRCLCALLTQKKRNYPTKN